MQPFITFVQYLFIFEIFKMDYYGNLLTCYILYMERMKKDKKKMKKDLQKKNGTIAQLLG
jgi:hypothetical protein